MAGVKLCGVRKAFGQTVAVEDVSLEIGDREFVVLVGPSGCGKSTTLRMIAGLEEITGGEIYIGDRLVNDVAPKDRDIAMVFQNYALYPHMNVYQNMAFALKLRRFPKEEIDRRVHEVAAMLGIEDLLGRKPKALSGGQRQRVAVGRAIVREPQVFLMDEPLSNLDAKLRVQMRSELSKLHNRLQTTMIYVTHDQTEAMTMGDRIVVMKDGRVMQIGAPLEIYEHPANLFVAGFIGSPAMNFFRGRLERAAGRLFFQGDGLRLPLGETGPYSQLAEKNVVLGLRPEDIHDADLHPEVTPECRAEVAVEVVEMMGSEAYVNATVGTHPLVARVEPATGARDGGRHTLGFEMSKARLFDPVSEAALA